jgi:hypothetical protein
VRYISTATGQPKVIYFTTSRAPNDNSYQSPFTASGITSARSYTVTCTTPENAIVSKTVTIGILPPVPSISATNGSVAAPPSGFTYIKQSTGAGSVTWAATGAAPNTCSVAGYPTSGTFFGIAPANTNAASGVSISPLAASTTYALMCPAFFTETATIMGGATLAAGRIGQAVSLSSGQMVQVTDLEPLHSDRQLTAAVWIYPTSFVTAWQNIVWKGNLSDCTTGCENREYAMWINSAGYIHAVSTSVNNIGISQTVCNTPAGSIALNQWQHVALVVNADAGNIKVYINGAEQASCPYSTSGIRTTSGFFGIGGSHGGGSFTGLIDDVRIYNRALTVAEVDTLNKAGTITSGQKAHFTFDTNFVSGTTASGAFSSSAQVAVVPPTCQDSTSLSCSWQCNTGLNSAQVYDDNQPSVSWCCPANFGETGATITGPNGFSLARPASGTYVLPPGGGAYSVTCNPSGSAGSASYSVLAETSADLRVVGRTRPNTKPILQYKINGIGSNTCTLTGRGVSLSGLGVTATGAYVTAPAGSLTITRPEKYTLTCSDGVGTKSWTATANILPSLIEI